MLIGVAKVGLINATKLVEISSSPEAVVAPVHL